MKRPPIFWTTLFGAVAMVVLLALIATGVLRRPDRATCPPPDPDLRGACAGAAGRAQAAIANLSPEWPSRDAALTLLVATAEWTRVCTDEPLASDLRARVLSATLAPTTEGDFARARALAQILAAALEPGPR